MTNNEMFLISLTLFGEGGGDGGASDGGAAEAATSAENTGRKTKGEYDNVVFGKQSTDTADQEAAAPDTSDGSATSSNTLEDRRKAFNELINGEFKDEYTQATQNLINRRFKETKTLEEAAAKNQPLLDMLYQRYGVADGDAEALKTALENDNEYWQAAADEAGMTVDQYKEIQKLKRENQALMRARENELARQRGDAQLQKWYAEGEALKQTFPNFNLAEEAKNPQFLSLLKAGTPMELAYKATHFDIMVNNATAYVAKQTEQKVINNVRARGTRPVEGAAKASSAFTVKDDVSKLTRKDRAEIARRAERGDMISF